MFDQMKKLMELQAKAKQVKKELEIAVVNVDSSNGRIKIEISGDQMVKSLDIADELLAPGAKERLKQELVNGINQAIKRSQQMAAEKFQAVTGVKMPSL